MNQAQNLKYKLEYLDNCNNFDFPRKAKAVESLARTMVATIADLEERLAKLEVLANGS